MRPTITKWTNDPITFDFYQALIFLFLLWVIELIVKTPFDLYNKFQIQEEHGFNKMTIGAWIKDEILGTIISIVIAVPVLYLLLLIIYSSGDYLVLYVGIFMTIFVLFFMVIAPICIMPIFNKYDQIEENDLKKQIESLSSSL